MQSTTSLFWHCLERLPKKAPQTQTSNMLVLSKQSQCYKPPRMYKATMEYLLRIIMQAQKLIRSLLPIITQAHSLTTEVPLIHGKSHIETIEEVIIADNVTTRLGKSINGNHVVDRIFLRYTWSLSLIVLCVLLIKSAPMWVRGFF